ncbi:hypothetical protein B0T10DRAFT_313468 [Thelonectria olida]|uniref:NACHT domain-containing protein n=1 Tax=Thelonectria olida TaxID=1576542 RepID=A0A9P8W9M1_9HYPO|nr:hypothetical protein B0T10DRAFT_313468 [Thelonectria olida]
MAASSWLHEDFRSARDDFMRNLKNPSKYDFSKFGTVGDVYDAAEAIQKKQAQTKTLRAVKRLEPFINGLKEYAATVEVFVQVKPEILGLIWGPLKFLLQVSSSLITAFEKVVKVLADIGHALPQFQKYASLFHENDGVNRVMCLFYVDILELYKILLDFMENRRLNVFLESLWPNIRGKISVVQANIEQHKMLMTSHVTLEHVLQSYNARKRAIKEYEKEEEFRESQSFKAIFSELSPETYERKLASILQESTVDSGGWLNLDPAFEKRPDTDEKSSRCIWIRGIPGSGKTFVAANTIRRIQAVHKQVLYIFLTYENQALGAVINVFHSLIFQAVKGDSSLRPILNEKAQSHPRKMSSDRVFVKNLLLDILKSSGPTFIVVDGVDELEERPRQLLLQELLQVVDASLNSRLLISSREERDIERIMKSRSVSFRVDHSNSKDIQAYVDVELQSWLLDLQSCGADVQMLAAVRDCVSSIVRNSQGMFLYTKLMVFLMREQGTASGIKAELECLPDGLDKAYSRVISRIMQKISPSLRKVVKRILQWIACAQRPLREEELLQTLAIEAGAVDFTNGRKEFRDIRMACGPIVEVVDDVFRFVHFSAKEYLLGTQSEHFLNIKEAHVDAVLSCSSYLSYRSMDLMFDMDSNDKSGLDDAIVAGDFVFFDYACSEWLWHLQACLSEGVSQDELGKLSSTISRLADIRGSNHIEAPKPPKFLLDKFVDFRGEPEVHMLLANVAMQHESAQSGLLDDSEGAHSKTDPLQLLSALRTLRQHHEDLVCPDYRHKPECHCNSLGQLYGASPFYCRKPFCEGYWRGFGTKAARDEHMLIHRRPYLCPEAQCIFSKIGFRSKEALKRHGTEAHRDVVRPKPESVGSAKAESKNDNTLFMLEDAIAHDDLSIIQNLTSSLFSLTSDELHHPLCLAAWKSSPETLEYLLDVGRRPWDNFTFEHSLEALLATAIETNNLPNIKVLLAHGADAHGVAHLDPGFQLQILRRERQGSLVHRRELELSSFCRALSLWEPDLMRYLVDECGVALPKDVEGGFCRAPALAGLTEEEVAHRFSGIRKYIVGDTAFDRGVGAAIMYKSVAGLKLSLENGGDPDTAFNDSMNVLFRAVDFGTNIGAEMAKILIKYGANPDVRNKTNYHITSTAGMKKVEAYFGATWDEIVRRIRSGEDIQPVKLR